MWLDDVRGGVWGAPPVGYEGQCRSAPAAGGDSDTKRMVDHRDGDIEVTTMVTVRFRIMVVDMLLNDLVFLTGIVMIDVLLNHPAVVTVVTTAIAAMVMPRWNLVTLMICLVVPVPFASPITISPSVAAHCQCQSYQ